MLFIEKTQETRQRPPRNQQASVLCCGATTIDCKKKVSRERVERPRVGGSLLSSYKSGTRTEGGHSRGLQAIGALVYLCLCRIGEEEAYEIATGLQKGQAIDRDIRFSGSRQNRTPGA